MRKPSAPLLAAVGVAALVAAAGSARAQRGVDSEMFRPALDSYGIFTVDRAQTSHQWDWGFKLFVDYAQNPLRLDICPATGRLRRPRHEQEAGHARPSWAGRPSCTSASTSA